VGQHRLERESRRNRTTAERLGPGQLRPNGKVVVAFFGRAGLHAYRSTAAALVAPTWARFRSLGTAACPVCFMTKHVIQKMPDSESPEGFAVGVDYRTDRRVEHAEEGDARLEHTHRRLKVGQQLREMCSIATAVVRSYDPKGPRPVVVLQGVQRPAASGFRPLRAWMVSVVNGLRG